MIRQLMRLLSKRLENWRDLDTVSLKHEGYFPNHVYSSGRRAAIVVKINEPGGGGAVNAKCLEDAVDAIEANKLDEVKVILHDGVHVVGEWPVGEVCDLIVDRHDPITGKWGPYYWLMPDLSISTIDDFKARLNPFR